MAASGFPSRATGPLCKHRASPTRAAPCELKHFHVSRGAPPPPPPPASSAHVCTTPLDVTVAKRCPYVPKQMLETGAGLPPPSPGVGEGVNAAIADFWPNCHRYRGPAQGDVEGREASNRLDRGYDIQGTPCWGTGHSAGTRRRGCHLPCVELDRYSGRCGCAARAGADTSPGGTCSDVQAGRPPPPPAHRSCGHRPHVCTAACTDAAAAATVAL